MELSAAFVLAAAVWFGARAETLPVKAYTTADGLPRNNVTCILQDSRGFMWFGTTEGLARFDGARFTTYSAESGLASNLIQSILETRSGHLWFVTGAGIARLRPPAPEGPRFSSHWPEDRKNARHTNVLLEDRSGRLWLGTEAGLYVVDTRGDTTPVFRFVDLGPPGGGHETSVIALLEDRRGDLWIGADSGVYRRKPNGPVERYTTANGLIDDFTAGLLEDRNGRLWTFTPQGGICVLVENPQPGQRVVERAYTTKDGLPNGRVEALYETRDRRLLAGTFLGLAELDRGAGRGGPAFRVYNTAHGLIDTEISAMAEDNDGNLWLGASGGAMKVARDGFTSFSGADGLKHTRVRAIFESRSGDLMVMSGQLFLNRFDGRRFQEIRPNYPAAFANGGWAWHQYALEDRAGEWWIGTGAGLFRFPKPSSAADLARLTPLRVYTARDGLADNAVFRVFEDSRGDIWMSPFGKVSVPQRWERATGVLIPLPSADGLSFESAGPATAFGEDAAGSLWIGFYNGGLARWRDGRLSYFRPGDGAPRAFVGAIHRDHGGRLWVASGRGLVRVDQPVSEWPRFVHFTALGLGGNICCVTEDTAGRIYVGLARGILSFVPGAGGDLNSVREFTTADGLAGGDVSIAYRDRKGRLWFGTHNGLSVLRPAQEAHSPAPVWITSLSFGGRPHPISERGESAVSGIRLQPGANDIEISYAGLAFGAGEQLAYQVRLEGFRSDWGAASGERSVHYVGLAPGTYRFQVRAIREGGLPSEQPATVSFTVLPPWWREPWFPTAVLLLAGGGVFSFHRYRLRRALEVERLRMGIATDLHDDLGAALTQIAILSEVARAGDRPPNGEDPLERIGVVAREMVDSLGDLVWAIRPQSGRLADLAPRMRAFAGETLAPRGISFLLDVPEAVAGLTVTPELRRQAYFIFKESVNNSARHSGCRSVRVAVKASDGRLEMTIGDDGYGFDAAAVSEGNRRHGLTGMRWRSAAVQGSLVVNSAPGEGTSIVFSAPLDPHKLAGGHRRHSGVDSGDAARNRGDRSRHHRG